MLLVGLFVLDLLTIHPFDDGNGRVVQALTNALLDEAGYTVGTYVSLEQLIAETADAYYETLLASTHGWHEGRQDVWPWLEYVVDLLARAYDQLERGAAASRSGGTKQDRVREYVTEHAPTVFGSPTSGPPCPASATPPSASPSTSSSRPASSGRRVRGALRCGCASVAAEQDGQHRWTRSPHRSAKVGTGRRHHDERRYRAASRSG